MEAFVASHVARGFSEVTIDNAKRRCGRSAPRECGWRGRANQLHALETNQSQSTRWPTPRPGPTAPPTGAGRGIEASGVGQGIEA